MQHKQSLLALTSLLVLGAGLCQPALAQTARSGGSGGSQNAQLVQQLQQLASERTSLQAENAKMKKELDEMRKERDTLKKAQQGLDQRAQSSAAALAQSASQREATEQELKKAQDRMQEIIAKFRETAQALNDVETDRTATKQTLAVRDQDLKSCVDHNLALYTLNGEVLTRLENRSVFSRMAAAEPFTKIKRVQLENLVDDYKARAETQRLDAASQTSVAAP